MRLSLCLVASIFAAAPAVAADLGTYRPGTPYHSVMVPTANVCESQCDGDARCRGWNYVKASPDAPGVCEFQSSVNAPVSSAISISGLSGSAQPLPSRVERGNTNTIRVGTQMAHKTQSQRARQGGRQITRQPVPQNTQSFGRPALAGAAPAFRPALDGSPIQAVSRPMQQTAIVRRPVGTRTRSDGAAQYGQPAPSRPQAARPVFSGTADQRTSIAPPNAQPIYNSGRPPIGQPINPPPMPQKPAQTVAPRGVPQIASGASGSMPRASVTNPVSWTAQPTSSVPQQSGPSQSLYGGLYDDTAPMAGQFGQVSVGQMPVQNARPTQPVTQRPLADAQPR
jgi:hypothetical protein